MSWRRGTIPNQRKWRKLRVLVLDRDGWVCQHCGKNGRMEVDHKIPLDVAPDKMWEMSNLQSLCTSCHWEKSQAERTGRKPDPEVAKWRKYMEHR